jgi:hypothetical protein
MQTMEIENENNHRSFGTRPARREPDVRRPRKEPSARRGLLRSAVRLLWGRRHEPRRADSRQLTGVRRRLEPLGIHRPAARPIIPCRPRGLLKHTHLY